MTGPSRLSSVPKVMLSVYEKIVRLTDDVCDRYLNSEYRDLARALTGALCRKRPSPVASGEPRTWACSIVYVLGRMNFLSDKSFSPHMTTADLCAGFDVGDALSKKRLGPGRSIRSWTLPSLVEKNPLVWMAQCEETNAGSARWQTREPQIRRELLKASTPFRRPFEEEYFRRPLPSSSS